MTGERMEERGETIMAMTIPTADGQGIGGFLDELKAAARAALRAPLAPDVAAQAWVKIEDDTVTDVEFVAELCGVEADDVYFRVAYRRGEDGRIVLGEHVRVEERTTYEPAAVALSAVLCELAPVHAPAADGLVRGRTAQLMRVGPLHDAYTGEELLTVTDEMLAAMVAAASAAGYSIPIDHGHALYAAQASGADHADVKLYGRIVSLEHRPGVGLFGVPEWTPAGFELLQSQPGLLYFSPTIVGTMHDPATGRPLGRGLHSVSLTPTPRQDRIDSLALSRAAAGAARPTGGPMTGNQGTGTPKPDDVVTLSRDEHAALTLARQQLDEVRAERDALKDGSVALSQRVEALEAAALQRQVADEIREAESAGKVVTAELRTLLATQAPAARAVILSALPASRPVVALGHGERVEPKDAKDPAVILRAVKLAKDKNISYGEALSLARGE
jgi:phage I-like protein